MKKKLVQQLKVFIILSVVFLLITQSITLISPIIMRVIIDDFIPNKQIDKLSLAIIIFVIIPFLYVGMNIVFNYFSIKYARNKGNDISIQILKNIVNQKKVFSTNTIQLNY
ncbi:MAG TPA: hypothetical protein PLW60_01600 [Bacilli bacterium]|nr:MAG: hypothetical protein BWY97_01419 [Tenericutes bacterium ADurb.BinA124]HNZ50055.1 hypothetical protein [Bacilli bacterium]HPX84806.1 hypothetical protein [Bacilli bacterium]HQC74210.1 hypothetical protein [Bacilli bacterium]